MDVFNPLGFRCIKDYYSRIWVLGVHYWNLNISIIINIKIVCMRGIALHNELKQVSSALFSCD